MLALLAVSPLHLEHLISAKNINLPPSVSGLERDFDSATWHLDYEACIDVYTSFVHTTDHDKSS